MRKLIFWAILAWVVVTAPDSFGWVIERQIHEGATLDGYARYLESDVEEIRRANPRLTAKLKVGENIKIPSSLPDLRALESKVGDLTLKLETASSDAGTATDKAAKLRARYEWMDYAYPFVCLGLLISILINAFLALVVFKRKRRRVEDSLRHVDIKAFKQRESEWLMKPTTTTGKINSRQ